MAYENPLRITFTIEDEKRKKSRLSFYCMFDQSLVQPTDCQLTETKAYARELARVLDDDISGIITSISITEDVPLPSEIKAVAENGSDVEEKLLVTYRYQNQTTIGREFRHEIPTFKFNSFANDGYKLTTPNGVTFIALLTFIAPDFNFDATIGSDRYGNTLQDAREARKMFKSS